MTITLLFSLIGAALLAAAIIEIRDRVRIHSLMNSRVAKLMRGLRQGEA